MAVKGAINSANIRDACAAAKMQPLCDHSSYSDGTCLVAGSNWHFSTPASGNKHKFHSRFFEGAFVYTSNAKNHLALVNIVNKNRWSTANDEDGDTVCATRVKGLSMDFKWNGREFIRVAVEGKMTSNNIRKACAAKGLSPVCDHNSYFDGQCVLVKGSGAWHFSHPSNVKSQDGLDQTKLLGAYFYAGSANGQWSMENIGNTHAWSNARDKDGDTFCTKSRAGETYDWKGYSFQRVAVKGDMNSANIREACAAAKMRPLCDHSSYSDGICVLAGANWHFSHPSNTKKHGVDNQFFSGSYLYASNAKSHNSLWNNGVNTHVWSKPGKDKNGDSVCVKAPKPGSMDFTWNNRKLVRVPVVGSMRSANILAACVAKGLTPVCDHKSYNDNKCVDVTTQKMHMSSPPGVGLPTSKMLGAYFYCGTGNGGWALQNIGGSHRWSASRDRDGETYCTKK